MSVMPLDRFPNTLPRSNWRVTIDGEQLKDWVGVNFRWYPEKTDHPRIEVQLVMPASLSDDSKVFIKLMIPKGRKIELIATNEDGSDRKDWHYVFENMQPVLYELLPVVIQGTQVEGLDRRADWPVLQSITFWGNLKDQRRYTGDRESAEEE